MNNDWHWRDSSRIVCIGPIEISALIPFVGLIFIHSWTLFYFAIALTVFLSVSRFFGWSSETLLIAIRSKVGGKVVSSRRKMFHRFLD